MHLNHLFTVLLLLFILLYGAITAIRVIGWSVTVTAGEDATLFCQLVDSKEKLTRITWQKKTRGTLINKDFFVITPDGKTENKNGLGDRVQFIGNIQETNGTILLKNVTLLDEGVYTCTFPSGPFETALNLNVQAPPVVSVSTDVIPVAGDSEVSLATCTAAKALPAAGVSWGLDALSDPVKVKNTQYEDPDGSFTVKSHLIGVPSKHLNQQKVQCLVRHPGQDREVVKDYALIIHYPPQVVYIKSVTDSTANSAKKEFQCVTDANPQPTKFIWSRNQKPLSSGPDDDRLTIQLSSDNNGLYMCKVSNPYGNGTGTLYLHTFKESTIVCWAFSTIFLTILLTILGITVCFIRRRQKQPQKTISSVPKTNRTQNHCDRSVVAYQTLLRHAQGHKHQDQVLVTSLKVASAESVDPGTREIITKDTRRQGSFENNDRVDPCHCVTDQRTAKEENLTISSASPAVVLCHCAHKLPDDGNNRRSKASPN